MRKFEIIYKDECGEVVIGEFSGDGSYTIDEALDIVGVDMDAYAEANDWDGYDWNCLDLRIK